MSGIDLDNRTPTPAFLTVPTFSAPSVPTTPAVAPIVGLAPSASASASAGGSSYFPAYTTAALVFPRPRYLNPSYTPARPPVFPELKPGIPVYYPAPPILFPRRWYPNHCYEYTPIAPALFPRPFTPGHRYAKSAPTIMTATSPARGGVSPSSSPRLPSPPPFTEVQIGPKSPSVGDANPFNQLGDAARIEDGSTRRIRPGTKAADMASGPPLVPLNQVRKPSEVLQFVLATN